MKILPKLFPARAVRQSGHPSPFEPWHSFGHWPLVIGHFALLLFFTFSLLALAGCSRKPSNGNSLRGKPGAGAPVPVLVTKAVLKSMPVELPTIGNVTAYSKVAVRSRVNGELTQVHFQEGQEVKRGDVLFTIDPRPFQVALKQTEANLARDEAQAENARVEYGRQKKLVDASLISPDEFDKADANLKALQAAVLADTAAVSNANLNLEFTRISSPIDGRTGNLLVNAGNVVQAGTDVLLNLNQIHPIYISFSVPEQYYAEITARMAQSKLTVEAKVPGRAGTPPRGELSFLDNSVDATTGMIQLKATFANEDNALWPGQFVEVVLKLAQQSNVVVVPTQAVQSGQTNEFVFLVKADQTVEMRSVKPGLSRAGETVVELGLKGGETVVTDGQLRLVPGVSKVSIRSSLDPAAAATDSDPGKGI